MELVADTRQIVWRDVVIPAEDLLSQAVLQHSAFCIDQPDALKIGEAFWRRTTGRKDQRDKYEDTFHHLCKAIVCLPRWGKCV